MKLWTITSLYYGKITVPKGNLAAGLDPELLIDFPYTGYLLRNGEENVLENFSLKVPFGTHLAIVGETGAGKSTLVNLACRFFEPTKGRILIDGVDYRNRSLLWLESQLSYVLQSPHLFSGTVLENIKYAKPDATMEQVIEAAKRAQAHEFIEKLPDGYNTDIGQGGDKLSTGQKQLISIARAILANSGVLLMDESTSALDAETEKIVIDNLQKKEDITVIIITHREAVLDKCDRLITVANGKIEEK